MGYARTIPRDLFNEANLLKCYGQIYLNLEPLQARGVKAALVEQDGDPYMDEWSIRDGFQIEQDESDGSIWVANVLLIVRGNALRLRRPLNSRDPWPLWACPDEDNEIRVFDPLTSDGKFSPEMLILLSGA